ncbi:hypothetical protein BST31_23090 [Mycobacterium marseillense]|nr:hypothetical protein BST31_23090 [Mycobacterium marseillense]
MTGAEGFGYMVGGLGLGMGSNLQTRTRTELGAAQGAAAAARSTTQEREQARSRRRPRSVIDPGYRYEFIEAADDADAVSPSLPDRALASDSRGSVEGFTGTLPKPDVRAAGLVTLGGNESGDGARLPMLPESWDGQ